MSKKLIHVVSVLLVLGMVTAIASGRPVKINFQQAGGEVPEDYLPDYGEVFGDRGNGWSYGWNRDIQADSRDRGSANSGGDQRYDTLIHLQKEANAIWEIKLPNGIYELFMVCGDPDYTDQTNNFDVEGEILVDPDGQAGAGFDFDEFNVMAIVADGRLTIQPAEGAVNSKIMFLDILGPLELVNAYKPDPDDGASHPKTWVRLSWRPGVYTVTHDVYFGENFDDVHDGTGGTFRGNQPSNDFLVGLPGCPYPDGLVLETTYYWRIDEVEADGVTKHKGRVWSFFVPTRKAYPSAVSTFHCIGVYWSPQDGSSYNVCQVHYRSYGSTDWKEALPLWYDDREVGGYTEGYRGSIVNLEPGTVHEIKLELLNTGTEEELIAETWSEDFPIARTVYLPAGTTNQSLEITESGSPDGYILYTHPEGESSTINVNNQEDSCIYVSASYIIIRGLTLREASVHGIRILNNVHDVVIEECDISGWGSHRKGEWGSNLNAAVYSDAPNIERIIIQRNKLHHPRYDTNSWKEDGHPDGPYAIGFKPRNERAGHYVIRYNEIYSDEDHYYNDCMGESKSHSYTGFPIRDSDIYGNYIANCWDDGIEAEGANCNVRIWGNYITRTPIKIATRNVTVGPLYVWRNVFGISRAGPAPEHNYGWPAFKAGNYEDWSHGKYYVFHNTILQPPPPDAGSSSGIISGDSNTLGYMFTRNNILHISSDRYDSIFNQNINATNDFDYDLFNGNIVAKPGSERNGINGVPIYDPDNGIGEFALAPSSPGYDAGVVIPNFNDNYNGAAPDIGAHEAGSPPMEFGVNAYQ